ncbi:MAG: hypothetical protein ACI9ON_004101 [Limisphaerales bacterium]
MVYDRYEIEEGRKFVVDQWVFQSETFGNCNCASNCGCQFNVPSTHGFCQFVEGGHIVNGHYNDTPLTGLNWAFTMIWPGEIAEGSGKRQVIIDERADAAQREALERIVAGQVGAPGSNHFSVFGSTCTEFADTLFLPINFEIDIAGRTSRLVVPGLIDGSGAPIIDEFSGAPFHIAITRPSGSFEFTYAEIGAGTSTVQGEMAMDLDTTYAQYCEHHYNQDGLVLAA